MTTYAVGDIQGCLQPLQQLLEEVDFNPDSDSLWVVGDMVNRGPDSLGTLRFLRQLGPSVIAILGNHDLHFLALAYHTTKAHRSDTLEELLAAPDLPELIDWIRHCKLMHTDTTLGYTMVHAGIAPQWSLEQALALAHELESTLQSDSKIEPYLTAMYGNEPNCWHNDLTGNDRLRAITNYFTRLRFCKADGTMELTSKTGIDQTPSGYAPWFSFSNRITRQDKIIFGHWAALEGKTLTPNVFALDTGCIWGGKLTLMRLNDETKFQCLCHSH